MSHTRNRQQEFDTLQDRIYNGKVVEYATKSTLTPYQIMIQRAIVMNLLKMISGR